MAPRASRSARRPRRPAPRSLGDVIVSAGCARLFESLPTGVAMRRSGRGLGEQDLATSRLVSTGQGRPEQGDVHTHFLQLDGDLRVTRQTLAQRDHRRGARVPLGACAADARSQRVGRVRPEGASPFVPRPGSCIQRHPWAAGSAPVTHALGLGDDRRGPDACNGTHGRGGVDSDFCIRARQLASADPLITSCPGRVEEAARSALVVYE